MLLVKTANLSRGSKVGDIINYFSDEHKFTKREQEVFDIVKIDKTMKEIDDEVKLILPKTNIILKTEKDDYIFESDISLSKDSIDYDNIKEVWQDEEDWKELKTKLVHELKYDEEKIKSNYKDIIENQDIVNIKSLSLEI